MTDDDTKLAREIALRATVQALATHLRDTLPKETVAGLIDKATKRAREDAPPGLEDEAGNAVPLYFARV